MRGNFRRTMTKVLSFLFFSQIFLFSLVRATGTKDNGVFQGSFSVSFVYIVMAGAMISSGLLFVFKKIKIKNENKNISL